MSWQPTYNNNHLRVCRNLWDSSKHLLTLSGKVHCCFMARVPSTASVQRVKAKATNKNKRSHLPTSPPSSSPSLEVYFSPVVVLMFCFTTFCDEFFGQTPFSEGVETRNSVPLLITRQGCTSTVPEHRISSQLAVLLLATNRTANCVYLTCQMWLALKGACLCKLFRKSITPGSGFSCLVEPTPDLCAQ